VTIEMMESLIIVWHESRPCWMMHVFRGNCNNYCAVNCVDNECVCSKGEYGHLAHV